MKFYRFVYTLLGPLFRLLFRLKVVGGENEPAQGGLIACSNHLSNWDVIILAVALHRPVRYFAKAELFRVPLLKQMITLLGAFPAHRGSADLGAIKRTISILSDGGIVGFFPQGTRCPGIDPRSTQPKTGIGLLAYRSGASILPVLIETKDNRIRPGRKVTVKLGKPIRAEELEFTHGGKEEYERVSKYVFGKITDMIGDEIHAG